MRSRTTTPSRTTWPPTGEAVDTTRTRSTITGGSSVCIDDPVRMYLMQMGEIPLLTRAEEFDFGASRSNTPARRFRHNMLASDFVLQGAVTLLEKVRDGELRLDRTIEVSVTNTAEKKQILLAAGPEPGNAATTCCARTSGDFRVAISQAAAHGRTPRRLAAVGAAAATRRCGWSKN